MNWVNRGLSTITASEPSKNLAYKFIYKAPSKSSKQIMEFHPGRKVKIYKTIGNWVSINKKNTEWVYGDVLNRHEDLKSINRTKKIDLNIINELLQHLIIYINRAAGIIIINSDCFSFL